MDRHGQAGQSLAAQAPDIPPLAGSALPRQTPKVGAVCGNAARTVLCGGRPVMRVPTATSSAGDAEPVFPRHDGRAARGVATARADPAGSGAIVLTGAGRPFCAGGDVKAMGKRAERSFEQRVAGSRTMHQLPLMMRTLPKVSIGMINGPTVGAGLGLALACDLRVAGGSARFATGFGNIGYSGDFGGSWLLTRLVGTANPTFATRPSFREFCDPTAPVSP